MPFLRRKSDILPVPFLRRKADILPTAFLRHMADDYTAFLRSQG